MKISYRMLPTVWLSVIVAFTAVSAVVFAFLWVNSGGRIPLLSQDGYRVSFGTNDVDNLVYYNDVRMAGVKIGKVVDVVNQPGHAVLTIEIDSRVAPLHQGATIRVGAKSLVEESYVDVKDVPGPPLPSGSVLPPNAVTPSVQLDQFLNTFDPQTREQLGATVRSLGSATSGRSADVSALFAGLGQLGRGGETALHALATQSQQLQSLVNNTTVLLNAVDTQRGQIAQLVDSGQGIAAATADGRSDLEATMRQTPGVLRATSAASGKLTELAGALAPVARDLREASPALTTALDQLPDTSRELRGAMSPLNDTLDEAPTTLDMIPQFGSDTRDFVPDARTFMSDLNPVLGYLRPYGRDAAGFFTNFGAQASQGNSAGTWARISLQYSEQTYRGYPVTTEIGPLKRSNAYPPPGGSADPQPFSGTYPRVKREGR